MESARWLVLSPLLVAVAAGTVGPARLGDAIAGGTAWEPPPCPAGAAAGPTDAGAWYRLDAVLDRSGTLVARRLAVGVAGQAARTLDLAPESFASGPVNGLVLVGSDDGLRSRLRLLDPARACATEVADEADVVRSGVLAADGRTVFEHRVDRATRTDLGVWRRTLGGRAEQVLDGLEPDARLGPTFATDLVLAADGRLAVSSCTPAGCRVRVLDPDGTVTLVRETGVALGLAGDALVARAACLGLPCPVHSIELRTGVRTTLAGDAYAAAMVAIGRGGHVVAETADGSVAAVEVRTGRRVGALPAGAIPLAGGSTASAGAEAPRGSIALAPRGRPGAAAVVLLDPTTGSTRRLAESSR